jgi:uncharacterized protein (TIGR02757 family)
VEGVTARFQRKSNATTQRRHGVERRHNRVDRLRKGLEALRRRFDSRHLGSDPVEFLHRYDSADDQELVGLIASSLAYGNVTTIRASVRRVLDLLGPEPSRTVRNLEPRRAKERFRRFQHRWTTGRDMACLLYFARQMMEQAGSIGGFFQSTFDPEKDMALALDRFAARALALDHGGIYRGKALPQRAGVRYFFPRPTGGGACKRLNLFLRWMVRPADGVDVGRWGFVSPSQLVIPLDTHLSRIGRHLGWTSRKTPGWKMAVDITTTLAQVDPKDPIKYDFALSRMGILENCPRHPKRGDCDLCNLRRQVRLARTVK